MLHDGFCLATHLVCNKDPVTNHQKKRTKCAGIILAISRRAWQEVCLAPVLIMKFYLCARQINHPDYCLDASVVASDDVVQLIDQL